MLRRNLATLWLDPIMWFTVESLLEAIAEAGCLDPVQHLEAFETMAFNGREVRARLDCCRR